MTSWSECAAYLGKSRYLLKRFPTHIFLPLRHFQRNRLRQNIDLQVKSKRSLCKSLHNFIKDCHLRTVPRRANSNHHDTNKNRSLSNSSLQDARSFRRTNIKLKSTFSTLRLSRSRKIMITHPYFWGLVVFFALLLLTDKYWLQIAISTAYINICCVEEGRR